ncbi:tRNA-dihydrouridine synthase 3 [Ceratobasidium sp. 392]|nr:tRNA-dihydrouridine synthase 3 [Ceratobasidium sp. 392]
MATQDAESENRQWPPGTARIKSEYLIGDPFTTQTVIPDDDALENATNHIPKKRSADTVDLNPTVEETKEDDEDDGQEDGEPAQKKQRLPPSERKRLAKEKRKEQRGANKARKFTRMQDEVVLCHGASRGEACIDGDRCRFVHDIPHYLASKPADIAFPPLDALSTTEPFIAPHTPTPLLDSLSTLDAEARCPNFACSGKCQSGFKCRFLGSHIMVHESETGNTFELVKNEDKFEKARGEVQELNYPASGLQKQLRTHKYPTLVADAYIEELSRLVNAEKNSGQIIEPPLVPPRAPGIDELEAQKDKPDVPIRASEKKRLRWQGMSWTNSELSLVRRHPIEKTFGVQASFPINILRTILNVHFQIAGAKLPQLVRAAEMLKTEFGPNNGRERTQIDFVDVNCGCPIDLVFKTGAGSALLDNHNKLGRILIGMCRALGEVPLTIKVRTGIKEGKNTSHKLMPRLARWGVNAFSIHGRTRQQRYSKLADWDYIKECVEALRASTEDDDLPTIPIFGGGDVYSAEQYWTNVERTGVDGIMVGRGALIKPWIFTEIAERREWDISSRERLDMVRQYAEFGLK